MLKKLLLIALLAVACSAQAQTGNTLNGVVFPALSRTAVTVTSADQTNIQWKGGQFIFNVSAYVSGTYTPTIQGKDPVSGTYYTLLQGPAISSTSTTVMQIYPGLAVTATGANSLLPRTWRVSVTGVSSPSMNFSLGMQLAP